MNWTEQGKEDATKWLGRNLRVLLVSEEAGLAEMLDKISESWDGHVGRYELSGLQSTDGRPHLYHAYKEDVTF